MEAGRERTFLVESYVPRLDEAASDAISVRIRAAVAELREEGIALRWLQSLALVDEETYLCLLAAIDVDPVALASERAGLRYDNVVEVIAVEPPRLA